MGDICRRADGYFFKGFSTTRVKKICLRQNHPLGGFKPLLCPSLGQKPFKNSSTAQITIIFIYKSRQENLIHGLPLQLCRKWPVFAVKKTYADVYVAKFFKGFSTRRVKKFGQRFRGSRQNYQFGFENI